MCNKILKTSLIQVLVKINKLTLIIICTKKITNNRKNYLRNDFWNRCVLRDFIKIFTEKIFQIKGEDKSMIWGQQNIIIFFASTSRLDFCCSFRRSILLVACDCDLALPVQVKLQWSWMATCCWFLLVNSNQ